MSRVRRVAGAACGQHTSSRGLPVRGTCHTSETWLTTIQAIEQRALISVIVFALRTMALGERIPTVCWGTMNRSGGAGGYYVEHYALEARISVLMLE